MNSTVGVRSFWVGLWGLCSLGAMACTPRSVPPSGLPAIQSSDGAQTVARLLQHMQTLASDDFGGRAPGTAGEQRTVHYIVDALRALGLRGGAADGSFTQPVPLIGITGRPQLRLDLSGSAGKTESAALAALRFPDDYVAMSRRLTDHVQVRDSQIIFVGHGVIAPEYGWDDYKGLDVRGKTLLMLSNDPQVEQAPGRPDPQRFRGDAMTYYGRWTYKYEIASRLGAAAVFIVHETALAGYPYAVVRAWDREQIDIDTGDGNDARVAVEGWLSEGTARALLSACGQDLTQLKKAAARPDFVPRPLPVRAQVQIENTLRRFASHNIVARIDGTDPDRKHQAIVYSAHWDHLGQSTDPATGAPRIFHGAIDNASGVAALIEVARGLRSLQPRRSILFMAPTAEEYGLLGAHYYTQHPPVPLSQTIADINMDMMNVWGPTRAVANVAAGFSDLDAQFVHAAAAQGRQVHGDPDPTKGYFFRADSFEFAKAGVPVALLMRPGLDFVDHPPAFANEKAAAFTADDYHKPSDVVKADWDLRGMAQDVDLLIRLGVLLDRDDRMPTWNAGAGFSRSSAPAH